MQVYLEKHHFIALKQRSRWHLCPTSFRNTQMHKNHSYQSHNKTSDRQHLLKLKCHRLISTFAGEKESWQRFTFNINTKVVAHFIQNEVYIFFCWYRMGSNISRAVCGPCNSHLLPWQEENHSTIAGGWVKQTHIVRAEIKKGHGSKQVRHHQGFCSCTPCTPDKVLEHYFCS